MKPKNAPSAIYWVEAKYPHPDRSKPMGGKFTRKDMAVRRQGEIIAAGGESTIYRTQVLQWDKINDEEKP